MKQVLAILAALALGLPASAAPVVIKLGTRAPDGSSWHVLLKDMAEKWREASGGQVELRIYPGGVTGDEPDMVRQMRIGKLHAAALTIVGLSFITPEPQVLSIPQLIESHEELDYVRDRVSATLESRLAAKGFPVLNWADGGWVHFMTTRPASTPEDVQKLKLFVWAGDTTTLQLYKDAGFNGISLASTDILPSLQTGLIEAVPTTPLIADATQMFTVAKHMIDHRWAPLVGATVVSASKWAEVPEPLRPKLLAIAREIGEKLRSEIRRQDATAIEALVKRGVTVHAVDDAARGRWRALAEAAYPKIRGAIVPADIFDQTRAARDEYRNGKGSVAGAASR